MVLRDCLCVRACVIMRQCLPVKNIATRRLERNLPVQSTCTAREVKEEVESELSGPRPPPPQSLLQFVLRFGRRFKLPQLTLSRSRNSFSPSSIRLVNECVALKIESMCLCAWVCGYVCGGTWVYVDMYVMYIRVPQPLQVVQVLDRTES